MKTAIAILMTILLAFSQSSAAVSIACVSAPAPCCDCGGTMKCCVASPSQSLPETPAPPATESGLKCLQLLQAPLLSGLMPPTAVEPICPGSHSLPVSSCAVPIFTRDCAFLI
ncbi:MAG TPA: hypothetical protein PKA41_19315 [Verrucomicrobiota bacterium]|nr:hypothetical protein [Verrucomicrobiota bacterium]